MGIDQFGCGRNKITGWERYAKSLAGSLINYQDNDDSSDFEVVSIAPRKASSNPIFNQASALHQYAVGIRRQVNFSEVDLYHSLTRPPARLGSRVKLIWTIHDDIILGGHPQYAGFGVPIWVHLAKRNLHKVDRFVTSTHSVRSELEILGVPTDKIVVIPPAASQLPPPGPPPSMTTSFGQPVATPREFVLCVGTIEPRKQNIMAARIAEEVGLPIVFVGGIRGIDPRNLGAGSLLAGRVSDAELSWCYANAVALISASAYEGINLPIYEALRVGLPVAASDIPVHAELVGESVELFAVNSIFEGTQALRLAIGKNRNRPIELLSSWNDIASAHVQLYKELLSV